MNRRAGLLAGTAALMVAWGAGVAAAQPSPEPVPRIVLDRTEVNVGDAVVATMSGLQGETVTVTVCGNLARRGSQDCANSSSVGDELLPDGPSYTQLVVAAPPVPCPCLVRAVANGSRDFAVAPVTIIGHPVGPVVSPDGEPLVEVAVEPRRAVDGPIAMLRSALGGPTRYEVTVSVRNVSTERLDGVVVRGEGVQQLTDDVANLDEVRPGPIEPGATWSTTEVVEVAAPVLGRAHWSVTATGAGPAVEAEETVRHVPWALLVVVPILVLDAAVMSWRVTGGRWRRRRRLDEELADRERVDMAEADLGERSVFAPL